MSYRLSTGRKPAPKGPGLFVATPSHLALWVERTKPAWARDLSLPVIASVDGILNQRAGIKWPNSLSNALSLLPLVKRNIERGAYYGTDVKNVVDYMATFREGREGSMDRGKHYHRWARNARKAAGRVAS